MPRRTELQQEVVALKVQVADLEDRLAKATAELELARTKLAATEEALGVSREEVDTLTEHVTLLQGELAAVRAANLALNVQVGSLGEDVAAAQAEILRLRALLEPTEPTPDPDPVPAPAGANLQARILNQ